MSSTGLPGLGWCSTLEELMLSELLSHQALGIVSESCEIFFFLKTKTPFPSHTSGFSLLKHVWFESGTAVIDGS